MNIRMIATSVLVAAALATAMVTPSATAAGPVQRAGIDINWVTHNFVGKHAKFLHVLVKQNNIKLGDGLRIYIDTRGKDPGPEYVVEGYSGSEWTLRHAETWKKFGVEITCPSSSFAINTAKDRSALRLARSCMNDRERFRLAVRANSTNGPNIDWWPSFHTFGNWFSV